MHKLIEFFLVMVLAITGTTYPSVHFPDDKPNVDEVRAQALLTEARNALGGEAKLKAVQSLAVSGKFRRILGPQAPEMSGEFDLEFLLPDKFKRTENLTLMGGAAQATRIEGFNGEQTFFDSSSSGGGMIMMRRPGGDDPKAQAAQLRALKADVTRTLVAWLLTVPDSYKIQFTYAGEADAPDSKADIIDAKNADGFVARLFLDKKTHQPLMLSYRTVAPKMVMRTVQATSREDGGKRSKEVEKQAQDDIAKAQENAQECEVQIFYADYRPVDGIHLPHKMSRSVNGEVAEEWEMTRFKINLPLKAEKFKK
jgi:hypothetical protein